MTRPCVPDFPPGRRPGLVVPPGACDTHVHVFGPYDRFPLAEDRSYTPVEAPVEAFVAHLDALGFERGVIVTASAQGTDNGAMLDALRRYPTRFRGVAVLPPETTDRTLDEMTAAGVRGLRLNLLRSAAGERTYRNGVGYTASRRSARGSRNAAGTCRSGSMRATWPRRCRCSSPTGWSWSSIIWAASRPRRTRRSTPASACCAPAARRPGLDQDLGRRTACISGGEAPGRAADPARAARGECRGAGLGPPIDLAAYRLFRPADVGGCGAGRDAGALDPGCRDAQGGARRQCRQALRFLKEEQKTC